MNPYYYLFYKLSCFMNKKGNNEMGPILALTVLLGLNLGVIYVEILPDTKENFQHNYKYGIIVLGIVLYIINCILFLKKNRVSEIMNQYKEESKISKKVGNFLVILYIALSWGIIVFV